MWGNSPTSHSWPDQAPPGTALKYYRGQRMESIRTRQSEIGHHAPVGTAGSAVTIERLAVVGTAPAGEREGPEPQVLRSSSEMPPEIQTPGTGTLSRQAAARDDLRPNFIARTANANPAVH
jgi:hypothetical protein